MACTWLALVAFAWLFLFSGYLARGKDVLKNTDLVAAQQNTSTSSVDMPAKAILEMTDKMVAGEQIRQINHWAVLRSQSGEHYGARATLNVYGLPTVKNGQISSIQIWALNGFGGPPESFNLIQAGWHVYPYLYGDSDTHFFVRWTADQDYKSGCFNFNCEGFIPDNTSRLVPGYRLRPLSEYNGVQRFITLKISKDGSTGDWWLHSGSEGTVPVGYWPRSLFKSLANSASDIHIGGVATFMEGDISPPMGSGHVVTEGEGKAASIKYPMLVDEHGSLHAPNSDTFDYVFDREACYRLSGDAVEGTVYVGGPGGCND